MESNRTSLPSALTTPAMMVALLLLSSLYGCSPLIPIPFIGRNEIVGTKTVNKYPAPVYASPGTKAVEGPTLPSIDLGKHGQYMLFAFAAFLILLAAGIYVWRKAKASRALAQTVKGIEKAKDRMTSDERKRLNDSLAMEQDRAAKKIIDGIKS